MSKKFVRSMVSLLLVFACMLSVAPIASAAASDDYTKWKQYDSAWNRQEAWPRNEYPNASMRYMKQAGCAVTSVAMLLRHYNVIIDSNVDNFNPWVCNENLKNVGAFTSAADLRWADISKAYPGFEYAGQTTSFSQSKLYDLYSQGYACLVNVNYKGSGHYVAVQSATSSGATIMDPGSSASSLSSYGTKYKIVYFTANPDSSQSFGSYATISDNNSPNTLKVGQPYSIKGTINSDTTITAVTAGVYTSDGSLATGKTVNPYCKSYNLSKIDPYVYFNKLGEGQYYYRVIVTNSAGTTTLVDTAFTVTNNSAGNGCNNDYIHYALKPACAPETRLDVQGGSTESQANIQIYTNNGTLAQSFELRSLENGYYAIISCVSGKALDVKWGAAKSGTNVWQYDYNGSDAQQWGFISAGDGYYYIVSKLDNNLCLDVSGGGSSSGLNVQVFTRNNTNAQKWMLVRI